jgi:hypothetical protein
MMQMLAYCNRQMGWKREGELDTVPGPGWQSLRLGSVQGLTNKQIVEIGVTLQELAEMATP